MNNNIILSVVVVNWNTKEITLKCIETIYSSFKKKENLEVVLVDNASTDGSVDAIRKIYPNVKLVVNKSNLGFAKANNIGLNKTQGKYIAFINSDIIVLDSCLDILVSFLEQHSKTGLCGPRILNKDLSNQPSVQKIPGIWNTFIEAIGIHNFFPTVPLFSGTFIVFKGDKPRKVDILSGCFWVVRKKAIDEVGPLDESFFFYGEDKEWCIRFKQKGWSVWYVPEAKAIHLGGASSVHMPVEYYLYLQKAQLKLWNKYFSRTKQFFMLVNKILFFGKRLAVHKIKRWIGINLIESDKHKAHLQKVALVWILNYKKNCLLNKAK